jgi:hypothetical protein
MRHVSDDVGVRKFRKDARFAVETTDGIGVMLRQHFDGDRFARCPIVGSKNSTHRPLAGKFADHEAITDDVSLLHEDAR